MIQAVVAVCGDDKYFDCAEISIPSFLSANAGSYLTVFTDQPERLIHIRDKSLEIRDFQQSLDRLQGKYRAYADHISTQCAEPWDNHGTNHVHKYVALLPVLGEAYTHMPFTLKIDIDSFFRGDLLIKVVGQLVTQYTMTDNFSDLYLVNRPNNGIIKPYGNELPGVGFLMWNRNGKFLDTYVHKFDGNEQSTVLNIANDMETVLYDDFRWHCVYPFWWAEKNGREFDPDTISPPYYMHIHASHAREKLLELKELYG